MKTILLFAGTRPEIIKMAPLVREFRHRLKGSTTLKSHFCFTGQHLEIAIPFLKFFDIEPDSRLEIMNPGQSLGQLSAQAMGQIDSFLAKETGVVASLVQGDTTTALMAALSSFYHKIPVGHVEAGLRTKNIQEPFPEELNRRMISKISTWNYAPTLKAKETLLKEQILPTSIEVTGNTGIDSFHFALERTEKCENKDLLELKNKRMALVTLHRRENLEERLIEILGAIKALSLQNQDVQFIFPVHPNPKVANAARDTLGDLKGVTLLSPLGYLDLVWLMKNAELILTDSGGLQEEAPSVKRPVLVLREETERPEAVEFGTSIVVGTKKEKIISTANEFLSGTKKLKTLSDVNPFGDGHAAEKIATHLLEVLR